MPLGSSHPTRTWDGLSPNGYGLLLRYRCHDDNDDNGDNDDNDDSDDRDDDNDDDNNGRGCSNCYYDSY